MNSRAVIRDGMKWNFKSPNRNRFISNRCIFAQNNSFCRKLRVSGAGRRAKLPTVRCAHCPLCQGYRSWLFKDLPAKILLRTSSSLILFLDDNAFENKKGELQTLIDTMPVESTTIDEIEDSIQADDRKKAKV